MIHKAALLRTEVSSLRQANETLSKRRKAKKQYIRSGAALTSQDVQDLQDQKAATEQLVQENRHNSRTTKGSNTKAQCCGVCGKPGHNIRTCKKATEMPDISSSNVIIVDFQYYGNEIGDNCKN